MNEGQEFPPLAETASAYQMPESPQRLRHSGLGIASFVWGIINGMLMLMVFLGAGLVAARQSSGTSEPQAAFMAIGFLIFGGFGACMAAMMLAIAGLFQRNRSKVFSTLGLVINLLVLTGTIFLVLLGVLMTA